ncbi:uncharacterized protein [Primulina huaijiensis]|uniref:uncharacterized protein n=1 Tax=Primulina huaijiensis TaxID=1492673 RepID=UPI003CC77C9B
MVSTRSRGKSDANPLTEEDGGGKGGEYEESRAQRIKENTERMKSLGIFELSKNLKPYKTPPLRAIKAPRPLSTDPPRRSSRLKDMPRVMYKDERHPKKEKLVVESVEICIPEGENPEVYTEEDEKLLGDSVAKWTLYVDGYDEDGQRIYDHVEGKSCHQCRQKTLGHHTECSKCKMVTGQFCGDCLYTRYGEHVLEVNANSNWICPVCRGICNCSRCRRDKGWAPTNSIYRKVTSLGYKSVAHYLIHNRRGSASVEVPSLSENQVFSDGNEETSSGEDDIELDGSNMS